MTDFKVSTALQQIPETVKEYGVDFQAKDGFSMLLYAVYSGLEAKVDIILPYNPDINLQDSAGDTALIYAAYNGYVEITKKLLKAGANPNIQGALGYTAIHHLVLAEHPKITKMLAMHKDTDFTIRNKKHTAFYEEKYGGNFIVSAMKTQKTQKTR